MLNKIMYDGHLLCGREKIGRCNFIVLDDNTRIKSTSFNGKRISIQCHECKKNVEIKFYQGKNGLLKRKYVCQSCGKIGEKNPFYGKKHDPFFKQRLSDERKGKWGVGANNPMWRRNVWEEMSPDKIRKAKQKISDSCSGEKNGFYGKKHTEEVVNIIIEKIKIYNDSLTDEDKKKISNKLSRSQKKLMKINPEKYRESRRKAAFASAKSSKRYKINKIEKIIQEELIKRDLDFKYSVILGYKQFDFGNKQYRVLLEVQGDYWHANPRKYGIAKNKRKLNDVQKMKRKKDEEKVKFALEHDLKLFHIWEDDINNSNFQVLDEIEEYINGIKEI